MTKIFSNKLSAIKYHTPFAQKMDNASLPQHAAVLVSNAKVSSLSLERKVAWREKNGCVGD